MSESDIAQVVKAMMEYARGKGQIPFMDRFILFYLILRSLEAWYNVKIIDLEELVERYSINAPAIVKPLWIDFISEVAKINTKTEIITQLSKRKMLE